MLAFASVVCSDSVVAMKADGPLEGDIFDVVNEVEVWFWRREIFQALCSLEAAVRHDLPRRQSKLFTN